MKTVQTQSKGHTYTNPWRGQYLMHAHSHITQAVAGGKAVAVGVMNRENPCLQNPYCRGECKAVYQVLAPHNTCGSCWLGTVQQFYHDMRGEGGSRVTSKLKQGAHIHQTHDLPSLRMSWENCAAVPSQQLPHMLCGAST